MESKFLFLDISTNLKLKCVSNGMKVQSLKFNSAVVNVAVSSSTKISALNTYDKGFSFKNSNQYCMVGNF